MLTLLAGVLIVGLGVGLGVVGLLVTHRLAGHHVRHTNNEVAGFFIAVVGVMYAVLLAFVVIVVWEDYSSARTDVDNEAADLISFQRLTYALPEPIATQTRAAARRYAAEVVETEWPELAHGKPAPTARAAMDAIWTTLTAFEPTTPREEIVFAEALRRLDDLSDHRQLRILSSQSVLPSLMWILLIGGAAITVSFTYFLSAPSHRAQLAMTVLYTALITFALFLIGAIDRPYVGDLRVTPEPFEYALELPGASH